MQKSSDGGIKMKERTYVDDVDRSVYDIKDEENDAYRIKSGLDASIVEKISKEKNDPVWMQNFRLQSLQIYNELKVPNWGPPIDGLNMDNIATYVRPNTRMTAKWSEVPEDIKNTFERLGIPQAERKSLAGVGAQYDSELVYHNVREEVASQGVVYTDMESALKGEYADMVKKYFMKLVRPNDHKFAALHGAVWSGGSFVYVPPGVSVEIPLQSYFRLNAPGAGQFEHTLIIVDEGADLHFIEGCSAPKYNIANLHAGCVELFVKKNARLRYSTIEKLVAGDLNSLCNGDNFLLGNSATIENNHLDTFSLISKLDFDKELIFCPLSYGGPGFTNYARDITLAGKNIFGEKFIPLTEILSNDEYVEIIEKCGNVIMNHLRQQALGNIITSMWKGARVYFNELSPVYSYYKSLGLTVYTLSDIHNFRNLPDYESLAKANRGILYNMYSEQIVKKEAFELVDFLLK